MKLKALAFLRVKGFIANGQDDTLCGHLKCRFPGVQVNGPLRTGGLADAFLVSLKVGAY